MVITSAQDLSHKLKVDESADLTESERVSAVPRSNDNARDIVRGVVRMTDSSAR